MAAPQNFRSAFNGFNREDVVHYIEYLNARHTEELNQLRSEVEFLNEKLRQTDTGSSPSEALSQSEAAREALEARCAELEALLETAPADNHTAQLEQKIQDLERQLAAAVNAKAPAAPAPANPVEQELEAYRRAERTERLARERAEQIYRTTNACLADATIKVDEAASQIGEMSDRVMQQLAQLQNAVTGSKQALRDAAATMFAIRPGSTEE